MRARPGIAAETGTQARRADRNCIWRVSIALFRAPSLFRITRGSVLRFAAPLPLATISSHLRSLLALSSHLRCSTSDFLRQSRKAAVRGPWRF